MKILLVSFFDPRESDGGAEQRTHRLWKALQKLGEVHVCVIVFRREDEGYDEETRTLKVCLERKPSLRWLAQHMAIRLLPQVLLPFHADAAASKIFPHVKFDAVVARYLKSAAYVKAWRFGPLFIDVDDDPVEVVDTRKPFPGFLNGVYSRLVRVWRDCVLAHAVAAWTSRTTRTFDVEVLENEAFTPPASYDSECKRENLLLVVGKLDYEPNQWGISSFLKVRWPVLRGADSGLQLAVIGKGSLPDRCGWWGAVPGVTVVGYVDSLQPWYERAFATIAPVESGGGTAIKVIESLNYGRPCLASAFARRGCGGKFGGTGLYALEDVTSENAPDILKSLRTCSPKELMELAGRASGRVSFSETVARTMAKGLAKRARQNGEHVKNEVGAKLARH